MKMIIVVTILSLQLSLYERVCVCVSLSSSASSSACFSFRSAIPFARDPTPDGGGHPYATVDRKDGHCDTCVFRRKTGEKMNFLEI